jgi:ElaB/YqjD/DUF883 family membrane-anchored ribosome-binding protein
VGVGQAIRSIGGFLTGRQAFVNREGVLVWDRLAKDLAAQPDDGTTPMSTASDLAALTKELNRLRADLDRVARATETLVRDAGEEALDAGREAWGSARENIERKIEERPLGAAAVAIGIGIVLGMLFGGRR